MHTDERPATPASWPATWGRWLSAGSRIPHGRAVRRRLADAAEEQLRRRAGAGEMEPAQAGAQPAVRRRHVPAPRLPRLHRHAADARRKCGRSWPTRDPNKREKADRSAAGPQRIRRLLGRQVGRHPPQQACNGQREQQRGTYAFHAWIRNAFATNMPYDQFVRGIIAAQGTVDQHPPVIWYRTVRNLTHQTERHRPALPRHAHQLCPVPSSSVREVEPGRLLSVAGVLRPHGPQERRDFAASRPSSCSADGDVRNPATGKIMEPRGLDGPPVTIGEDEDPRQKLVDWMAEPDNPFFARAIGNRLWAPFPGPRPGRTGGRHARDQSAQQPRTARRAGQGPDRAQVRSQAPDSHDSATRPRISCRPSRRRTTSTTSRITPAHIRGG